MRSNNMGDNNMCAVIVLKLECKDKMKEIFDLIMH